MDVEEPVASLLDPAHRRINHGAIAGRHQRGLRESGVLRGAAPGEACPIGVAHCDAHLREHVVRRRDRCRRVLQRLEGLRDGNDVEVAPVGDESRLLGQRLLRRDGDAVGKIGEVCRVRHPVVVDVPAQPRQELLVVLPRECPPIRVRDLVVRNDLADHFTHRRREQVAAVAFDHEAPPSHDAGSHRQVVIRCQIEIVGCGEFESANLRGTGQRCKKSGLALARQWELEPWRVQHRYVEKDHLGRTRRTDLAQLVHLDLVA